MTLYVSDLDGTLLAPDATLSARSRQGLLSLLDRGVTFTVASARSLVSMRQILGPLPVVLPAVAHNGAVTGDLLTGEAHRVIGLPAGVAVEVYETVRRHGLLPLVVTHDGDEEVLWTPPPANAGQRAYLQGREAAADPRLRVVADPARGLDAPVIGFTVIGARTPLTAIHRDLAGREDLHAHLFDDLYAPGWCWVTVHPVAASKADGVRVMAEVAGRGDEPLVVFGDQVNDLSMFDAADHAVAVANAAPPVLAAADEVIGPNADDAVVRWLEAHAS